MFLDRDQAFSNIDPIKPAFGNAALPAEAFEHPGPDGFVSQIPMKSEVPINFDDGTQGTQFFNGTININFATREDRRTFENHPHRGAFEARILTRLDDSNILYDEVVRDVHHPERDRPAAIQDSKTGAWSVRDTFQDQTILEFQGGMEHLRKKLNSQGNINIQSITLDRAVDTLIYDPANSRMPIINPNVPAPG